MHLSVQFVSRSEKRSEKTSLPETEKLEATLAEKEATIQELQKQAAASRPLPASTLSNEDIAKAPPSNVQRACRFTYPSTNTPDRQQCYFPQLADDSSKEPQQGEFPPRGGSRGRVP